MRRKPAIVALIILALAVAAIWIWHARTPRLSPEALSAYDAALASCGSFPNGANETATTTSRVTIYLPRDIYQLQDQPLGIEAKSGDATAGWISNAGPLGESYGATADCRAYYYEFDGVGRVDVVASSTIEGVPEYRVHFSVIGTK